MPHQLLFVRSADWNFHFTNFHRVLERVNVLDAVEVDHKISTNAHELAGGQFLQQVLQRSFHVIFSILHLKRAVLPFNFNVQNVVKRNLAKFVANLGVDVFYARGSVVYTTLDQLNHFLNRQPHG